MLVTNHIMTRTAKNIRFGKLIAILSFIIGTIMVVTFYFTLSIELAVASYFIIIGLGILSIIGLILVLFFSPDRDFTKAKRISIGLILANIPISIFYFFIIVVLINTLRITFVNETGQTIENVEIIGAQPKTIHKLEPNEKKTVWIGINGDSTLEIEYNIGNSKKREIVYGYITSSMGQIETYKIGTDKPIDESF